MTGDTYAPGNRVLYHAGSGLDIREIPATVVAIEGETTIQGATYALVKIRLDSVFAFPMRDHEPGQVLTCRDHRLRHMPEVAHV